MPDLPKPWVSHDDKEAHRDDGVWSIRVHLRQRKIDDVWVDFWYALVDGDSIANDKGKIFLPTIEEAIAVAEAGYRKMLVD